MDPWMESGPVRSTPGLVRERFRGSASRGMLRAMNEPTRGRAARLALRPLLLVAGAYHLALGALMVIAPRTFFDEIAAYGPYNDHYLRDVATFYLAFGVVLLLAVRQRSWQVPVLFLCLVQYGLHLLNHLWDVAETEPGWLGPVNAVVIALVGAGLWWLLRAGRAEDRSAVRRPAARESGD
jgi:hypothetical protein